MNAMETRIFQDLRRSNFLKSWLIFYRFGLKDSLMRATLMSIFDNVARCIPRFGDLEEWKFNEVFCHPPANDLSVEEAALTYISGRVSDRGIGIDFKMLPNSS